MRFPSLGAALLLLAFVGATSTRSLSNLRLSLAPPRPPPSGALWAVLVAGSAGWPNYRHQADVLHAYAVLVARGVPPSRIITLAADDLTEHPLNPLPGTVVNAPGGRDLRDGVCLDYTGTDVTAAALLAVLTGDAAGVANLTSPAATRRVLDALDPLSDRVLFFFSDHGGDGVLGMPSGPPLFGDQLVGALKRVQAKEVVVVVEACEAGSSFDGLLAAENEGENGEENGTTAPRLWVMTASAPGEPSWATYCDAEGYGTCLGDAFSVAWLRDAEALGGRTHGGHNRHRHEDEVETLHTQFARLRAAIAPSRKGDAGGGGSHVSQYGATAWAAAAPAAAVEGARPASEPVPLVGQKAGPPPLQVPQWAASGPVPSTVAAGMSALDIALAARGVHRSLAGARDWACVRALADAWAAAGCGGGLRGTAEIGAAQARTLTVDQSGLRAADLLARACEGGLAGEVPGLLGRACGNGDDVKCVK